MKCPRCGKKVKFIGWQEIKTKEIQTHYGGRKRIKLFQCKNCGSFLDPRIRKEQ